MFHHASRGVAFGDSVSCVHISEQADLIDLQGLQSLLPLRGTFEAAVFYQYNVSMVGVSQTRYLCDYEASMDSNRVHVYSTST